MGGSSCSPGTSSMAAEGHSFSLKPFPGLHRVVCQEGAALHGMPELFDPAIVPTEECGLEHMEVLVVQGGEED
eukprot:8742618-Alexandrium_andersonii.AAC.1